MAAIDPHERSSSLRGHRELLGKKLIYKIYDVKESLEGGGGPVRMLVAMNSLLSKAAPAGALTADPLSLPESDLSSLKSFGQRQSAAEFAYEQLREAVISLHLEPGTVIARGAIAQRLGV